MRSPIYSRLMKSSTERFASRRMSRSSGSLTVLPAFVSLRVRTTFRAVSEGSFAITQADMETGTITWPRNDRPCSGIASP